MMQSSEFIIVFFNLLTISPTCLSQVNLVHSSNKFMNQDRRYVVDVWSHV